MKKEEFNRTIMKIKRIVNSSNTSPNKWCFLTSIDYMLSSKMYMGSTFDDIKKVLRYTKQGSRILDFGTGCGFFAVNLSRSGLYVDAVDTIENKSQHDPNFKNAKLDQNMIWSRFEEEFNSPDKKNPTLKFQHYDGKKLPYKDNSFDAVSAYAVIEHVADDEINSVMNEIKRVLKPNGLLFIFKLPRKLSVAEYAGAVLGMGKHDKLYWEKEANGLFTDYGFEIRHFEREDMAFSFPPKLANKIFPVLNLLNKALIKTPMSIFSHHMNIILINRKEAER